MKFFISSTFEDLKDYRRVTIEMLEDITKGVTATSEKMEFFTASENTCKEECLKRLAESDIVIGIYGDKYGTIDQEEQLSMTEIEFDKAIEWGKSILAFVSYSDTREPEESSFIKNKVFKRGKSCGRFKTIGEYAICLNETLKEYFNGLVGFSYSSIWDSVEKAILRSSQNAYPLDGYGPNKEVDALNQIIKEIDYINLFQKAYSNHEYMWEYVYIGLSNIKEEITVAALYLKLCYYQKRLLTELWTDELRGEILGALQEYTTYLEGTNLTD